MEHGFFYYKEGEKDLVLLGDATLFRGKRSEENTRMRSHGIGDMSKYLVPWLNSLRDNDDI